jgi:hypothetical protein
MKPATTQAIQWPLTLSRSGPKIAAAIQSPRLETNQRTKKSRLNPWFLTCLFSYVYIVQFYLYAAKYLAISLPFLGPRRF